ncbi:MAG: WD domain, G-beta repeat [Methanoregula sp. PtaU1.Bin051]|nr:MAG: WD domain, G-beta repeat [Methanoregula sp. PtaU1.Bin051]
MTAARARKGDPVSLLTLMKEYCRSLDSISEEILLSTITGPISRSVTDRFCHEVLLYGDDHLRSLAVRAGVAPSGSESRVLFFFATGQITEYQALETGAGHPLLRAAYLHAPERVKEQVRKVSRACSCEIMLAEALLPEDDSGSVYSLSGDEWNIIIQGLIGASRHDELYRLLLRAPIPHALEAIRFLHSEGWAPRGSIRDLWEQAACSLPVRWTYPDPAGCPELVAGGPGGHTRSLVFSPDGSAVVTGGYDGTLRIWNIADGKSRCVIRGSPSTGGMPVFLPDCAHIVAVIKDAAIAIIDATSGKIVSRIPVLTVEDCQFALSQDNRMLACTDSDGTIRIHSLQDGSEIVTLNEASIGITTLAFSPDNHTLAAGYNDGIVRVWSLTEKKPIWSYHANSPEVIWQICWSEDRRRILVMSDKSPPRLLDAGTGSCRYTFARERSKPLSSSVSADCSHLVVAFEDDTVCVWRLSDCCCMACIPVQRGSAVCVAAVPESCRIVTGGDDGLVRIFRYGEKNPERMFTAHADWISVLAISPDGKTIGTAGWDGTTKLWDLHTAELNRSLAINVRSISCLAGLQDGNVLATGTSDGFVWLWRFPMTGHSHPLDVYTGSVRSIAVSRDGLLLASAGTDGPVRLWDTGTGSLLSQLTGIPAGTYCLAFTPDGHGILTGGWDEQIRLFSVPDGALIRTYSGHSSVISCIAFSPDGSRFVSGSNDGTIRIWDTSSGSVIATCTGDRHAVEAVAISPDGELAAAAGRDAIVRLFRLSDGDMIAGLTGAPSTITGLLITSGGDLLIASGEDGSLSYFSILARAHIRNVTVHMGRVCGISGATGGRGDIASAGTEGTVRIIPLPATDPLDRMTPDVMPFVARQASGHPSWQARQQWDFLFSILPIRFAEDICLCCPPPAIDEFDIMVVG